MPHACAKVACIKLKLKGNKCYVTSISTKSQILGIKYQIASVICQASGCNNLDIIYIWYFVTHLFSFSGVIPKGTLAPEKDGKLPSLLDMYNSFHVIPVTKLSEYLNL